MQSLESRAHSLRLICPDTHPEQVHFLGERSRISKYSVVVGFGIQFPIAKDEHPARSTESANVGKEIEVIERYLKCLHASHRKACHCTMIAIRECPKGRINKRNQGLRYIILKRRRHFLHRLHHFGRTKGLSGQIRWSLARAPGVAI